MSVWGIGESGSYIVKISNMEKIWTCSSLKTYDRRYGGEHPSHRWGIDSVQISCLSGEVNRLKINIVK